MKHTIIYIPGLGDKYDDYRRKALKLWPLFGVNAVLVPMNWYSGGAYDERFERASKVIIDAVDRGHVVSLVGESAGGSMAINLFASHPVVASVITIAGVNRASTPVAQRTLRRGPAFAVSRQRVDESLRSINSERKRQIYTLSALLDSVVRARNSHIEGARNYRVWSVGHLFTITLCLTFFAGYVIHLAKRN